MKAYTTFDAAVIGAGLAGGATAFALARRGARVVLVDGASQICSKGSGNLFGILTPHLATKLSPRETLYSAGYAFTQSFLRQHPACAASFRASGALQLPSTKRLASIVASDDPIFGASAVQRLSTSEASMLAGTEIPCPAFHIPDAGFLSPRDFIEGLLQDSSSNITIMLNSVCAALSPKHDSWQISLANGATLFSNSLIICTAHEAAQFRQTAWLPVEAIRGQTVSADATDVSAQLRCVISFGGYITPAVNQQHFVGAHYRHDDYEPIPRSADTGSILARCAESLPQLAFPDSSTSSARVCFRTSTIDRLPYVGAVPDYESFCREASQYRSGTTLKGKVSLRDLPGLYISVGHGSRGLLSCPIGGEIVARLVARESLHELQRVAEEVSPTRVPWRLIKNEG